MSENNDIINQLFEYRINLQDEYDNEEAIIKQLKSYLHNNNIDINQINTILFDFYKFFCIDIPMENIQAVDFPVSEENFESILSSLEEQINNNDELPDLDSPRIPIQPPQHVILLYNNNINGPIIQPVLPPIFNNIFQDMNIPLNLNNIFQNMDNNNIHDNMIDVINNFLDGIEPLLAQPNYENVKVTTDEADIMKLKSRTLEDKHADDCTICMGSMIKDEIVTELECFHTFHKDCIEPYLKDYNYKCPLCRKEVGKPKADI
jgi:hypothetical protein